MVSLFGTAQLSPLRFLSRVVMGSNSPKPVNSVADSCSKVAVSALQSAFFDPYLSDSHQSWLDSHLKTANQKTGYRGPIAGFEKRVAGQSGG